METTRLNDFITWQRSVLLAVEIQKLSHTVDSRHQAFLGDLTHTAMERAANIADHFLNLEEGFALWGLNDTRAIHLYTQLKVAEIAGVIHEREARRLQTHFDEVERMMDKFLQGQSAAGALAVKAAPAAWKDYNAPRTEGFRPLNEGKEPRTKRGP